MGRLAVTTVARVRGKDPDDAGEYTAKWVISFLLVVIILIFGFAGAIAVRSNGGGTEAPTISHPNLDIFVGEVPCPVVRTANGESYPHKAPCRQERDAMDPVVARIYNADGILIGGSTP